MEQVSIQLFLLPYAGGRADAFAPLIARLDSFIDPVAVEYPGRGQRADEPLVSSHEDFFQDVAEFIRSRRKMGLPYALFGYSMGAAFVYELTSRCVLDRPPIHLFYGARACIADDSMQEMTDGEILSRAKQLGGFSPKLLENPRLFSVFTHPLVDDFHIAAQYRYTPGERPKCDCSVFYSEADTPYHTVLGWKNLTDGSTDFHAFSGNHFFIREHDQEIAHLISQKLKERIG